MNTYQYLPLAKFLNGRNTNNKVIRWSLELATHNVTFEWISGAKNKAANCLSWLVEQLTTTPATVNMLRVTHTNGPASNTRSCMKKDSPGTTFTPHLDVTPNISPDTNQTPKPLTVIDWKLCSKCRGQIHSANIFLNVYLIEEHCNMKQIFYSHKRITV